jgi:hypothetical protein
MFEASRPDVTTEGWNTWPTEKVSHALVRDPRSHSFAREHAATALTVMAPDVAALTLAPTIRNHVESVVRSGEAEELHESLITFALSRVDWLQLARAEIEAALPEEAEPASEVPPLAAAAS